MKILKAQAGLEDFFELANAKKEAFEVELAKAKEEAVAKVEEDFSSRAEAINNIFAQVAIEEEIPDEEVAVSEEIVEEEVVGE